MRGRDPGRGREADAGGPSAGSRAGRASGTWSRHDWRAAGCAWGRSEALWASWTPAARGGGRRGNPLAASGTASRHTSRPQPAREPPRRLAHLYAGAALAVPPSPAEAGTARAVNRPRRPHKPPPPASRRLQGTSSAGRGARGSKPPANRRPAPLRRSQ